MDLNEAVTVDNKTVFCKTGNLLAIGFLVASRDAVMLAGAGPPQDLAWRVEATLAEMLVHRAKCRECDAAEFLARARKNKKARHCDGGHRPKEVSVLIIKIRSRFGCSINTR